LKRSSSDPGNLEAETRLTRSRKTPILCPVLETRILKLALGLGRRIRARSIIRERRTMDNHPNLLRRRQGIHHLHLASVAEKWIGSASAPRTQILFGAQTTYNSPSLRQCGFTFSSTAHR
jgi:hypothetical protein